MQPQECFQGVQPLLATPSYTTHSTKPTPTPATHLSCSPQDSRGTLAHRPGGILILFPLNRTATSWQKPKWREVFSPLFPTSSLWPTVIELRFEKGVKVRTRKSPAQTLACAVSWVGELLGTWEACLHLALEVFPLLGGGGISGCALFFGLEEILPSHWSFRVCSQPSYMSRGGSLPQD